MVGFSFLQGKKLRIKWQVLRAGCNLSLGQARIKIQTQNSVSRSPYFSYKEEKNFWENSYTYDEASYSSFFFSDVFCEERVFVEEK